MAVARKKAGQGQRRRKPAARRAVPKAAAKKVPARKAQKEAPKRSPARKVPAKKVPANKRGSAKAATRRATRAVSRPPAGRPKAVRPAATAARRSWTGACHCGSIEFTYETSLPPRRWLVQSCQCSFCRGHGARTTADPQGLVQFDFKLPEFLRRYRFGLRTGDFLICRECGTYVASVLLTGRGALANVNVNTLKEPPAGLPPAKAVEPELETLEQRRRHRAAAWTPVMGPV